MFFLAIATGHKNGSGQLKDVISGKGEPGILFMRMIAGIFFLGISTTIIVAKDEIDNSIFYLEWSEYDGFVWLLVAAASITGSLSASKKIISFENSIHSLPSHLPLSFTLIRTLFLIVYEFFFRGVVLFVIIKDAGITAAIVVNLLLYTGAHWFDKKERYGSIVMGFVLCGVSIYYHSVWPAILIHLSLALSHEITLLVNNKSLIKKSWL
jgi:membrane protease YdiL (CAAX protease family)